MEPKIKGYNTVSSFINGTIALYDLTKSKIIFDNLVKFVPVKNISDTGNGFWIEISNNLDNKEIMVITQGHEFTVEGEIVDFSFKND